MRVNWQRPCPARLHRTGFWQRAHTMSCPCFISFAFAVATVCGAVQCGVCVVGGWGLGRGRYGATAAREAGSSAVHLGLTPRKQLALQLWCKDFPSA